MSGLSQSDEMQLRSLEESLWREETRLSRDRLETLVDDSYLEFGSSGKVYNKRQMMDAEIQEINAQLPLPEFRITFLAPTVALLTYRSIQTFSDGLRKEARRASIWTKKKNGWKLTFHQGTLVR